MQSIAARAQWVVPVGPRAGIACACVPLRTLSGSRSRPVGAFATEGTYEAAVESTASTRRLVVGTVGLSTLAAAFGAYLPAATASEGPSSSRDSTTGSLIGKDVFFDVEVEGEPIGRIVITLFDDDKASAIAASRFRDLSVGKLGVGYRRSRFDGIFEDYLRIEGQRSLTYSATADSTIAGGESMEQLEAEMEAQTRRHDEAGLVSVIVNEAKERPITEKLIAKNGKLVTVQMQAGEAPNGTSFMITRGAAPDLDKTNLIVGKIVSGMDVIEAIAQLPFSKPRVEWYDGPFFAAGKAMGDKRAVVAEKGFNRPFKRVIISKTGLA